MIDRNERIRALQEFDRKYRTGGCVVAGMDEAELLTRLAAQVLADVAADHHPEVTEVRPQVLECDVVRFQNNKEKWVAFVGLLDGYPYEIFTGLQDDDEGIVLPKTVTHGKILKQMNRKIVKIDHIILY